VECHRAGERGPCAEGHVLVDLSGADANATDAVLEQAHSALSFGTFCAEEDDDVDLRFGVFTLPEACPDGERMDSSGECRTVFDFEDFEHPKVARLIDGRKKDWRKILRRRFQQVQ
jgi:hypothetical protein